MLSNPIVLSVVSLLVGAIISAFAAIFLMRFYKPVINIKPPKYLQDQKKLEIIIANSNAKYAAINLKIEVAFVFSDGTCHLDLDRYEFLMLAKKAKNKANKETDFERTFVAHQVNNYTSINVPDCDCIEKIMKDLKSDEYLRVRVYAEHELTGFGKFKNEYFQYLDGEFKSLNS
jgi:hypothetical protein